jgi:hypothetical protein
MEEGEGADEDDEEINECRRGLAFKTEVSPP